MCIRLYTNWLASAALMGIVTAYVQSVDQVTLTVLYSHADFVAFGRLIRYLLGVTVCSSSFGQLFSCDSGSGSKMSIRQAHGIGRQVLTGPRGVGAMGRTRFRE